ncbi:unnamed protein product [Auanema sp. JU1783]|nr:unnamed protein product [Auanema sp. JU1783]
MLPITNHNFLFCITQPRQQCCCPPPPSCGGGYGPPPAPPPAGYAPYRRKRMTQSGELEASSDDQLCNSIILRNTMKRAFVEDDEVTSRRQIHDEIKNTMSSDSVVLCTKEIFNFTATHDSEYCVIAGKMFNCFAFVF